jgi:hypothetical protein
MSDEQQEPQPGLFRELGIQVTVGLDVTPGGAADLPPEGAETATAAFHPTGYQGLAQHTYTAACDGFHESGPCPPSKEATVWPPA